MSRIFCFKDLNAEKITVLNKFYFLSIRWLFQPLSTVGIQLKILNNYPYIGCVVLLEHACCSDHVLACLGGTTFLDLPREENEGLAWTSSYCRVVPPFPQQTPSESHLLHLAVLFNWLLLMGFLHSGDDWIQSHIIFRFFLSINGMRQ